MSGNSKEKLVASAVFAAIIFVMAMDFTSAGTPATGSSRSVAVPPAGSHADEAAPEADSAYLHAAPMPEPKAGKITFSKANLDVSGTPRVGKASFYADYYVGRKMSDGKRMERNGGNAASMTLPLGTTARVTNLATGKSEIVTIQDRGPYVAGRLIDLSPGTAQRIGISRRQGLAQVSVAPIAVPLANGTIIKGAGANDPVVAAEFRNDSRALRALSGE